MQWTKPVHATAGSYNDTGVAMNRDWMDQARCTSYDPDLWYTPLNDGGTDAQRICHHCPVRADCYTYVMAYESDGYRTRQGIWAGLTPAMRTRQAKQAA